MAPGVLVILLGVWVLVQGLNGNAGRLVTGQIGIAPAPAATGGAS